MPIITRTQAGAKQNIPEFSSQANIRFNMDHTLTVRQNHQAILGNLPTDQYFPQSSKLSPHKCCTTNSFPRSIKPLLGLNLKSFQMNTKLVAVLLCSFITI